MSCLCVFFIVIAAIVALKLYKKAKKLLSIPPLPKLENTWWGPGEKSEEDPSITPFKIDISDTVLNDLQRRLSNARSFTSPLENTQHQYGLNTKLLGEIVKFWRENYNWREREVFLNKLPQFKISIQGLRLHYIHVKPLDPGNVKVIPLLLLHGWPGSVREFYEIIPILTTPQPGRSFVFEVIAPSLPGYGFSQAAVRPGLGAAEMAVVFKNLMEKLGFKKYYIQGGDWGAILVQNMATLFPEKILGLHSNMCFVNSALSNIKLFLCSFYPSLIISKRYENKIYPLKKQFANRLLETGYMHLQSTKPDTVGVALGDSPVGLAAYILEKFITWTNPEWKNRENGGLDEKYTYTNLLDNVMIYWVTNSITTSMRLYAETFNKAQFSLGLAKIPITVPTACARFSHEVVYLPSVILKEKYQNIVHESDHDGGHFAAFELPEILAEDIFTGIEKIELYHKKGSSP